MLLKERLSEYTKDNLLDQARSFEIRGCSGLRKAELIDKIVKEFCTEEMLRSRLACLTKEQMNIFRKSCISPVAIGVDEVASGFQLFLYWLGYFEDPSDRFCVFEEVKEVFEKIDDEEFKRDNQRKGWMMNCIQFFVNYYGIAPLEIIHKMYCQNIKVSMQDMIEMLGEFPMDIIESAIFSMDMLGMSDWPETTPLYSRTGLLVYLPLFEQDDTGKDELQYLINSQMDKDFYIPTVKQIDEICSVGYEESALAYRHLEKFLNKKMYLSYEQAVTWCLQIWANSYEGNSPSDIFQKLNDANIVFDGETQMNEFLKLLMNAHNGTRLKENRGHRPDELRPKSFSGGMPTIVPGSSHAAKMLSEAMPQLQAMGIPIDINGDSDEIQEMSFLNGINGQAVKSVKKVYPNDPCPCGSGKKYKKCCGRK